MQPVWGKQYGLLKLHFCFRILSHYGIRVHRRHLFFNITYTSLLEKKALHVDHTYQHDDPPRQFSEATHSFLEAVGSREETK